MSDAAEPKVRTSIGTLYADGDGHMSPLMPALVQAHMAAVAERIKTIPVKVKLTDPDEVDMMLAIDEPKILALDTEFYGWTGGAWDPTYDISKKSTVGTTRPFLVSLAWEQEQDGVVMEVNVRTLEMLSRRLHKSLVIAHNAPVDVHTLANVGFAKCGLILANEHTAPSSGVAACGGKGSGRCASDDETGSVEAGNSRSAHYCAGSIEREYVSYDELADLALEGEAMVLCGELAILPVGVAYEALSLDALDDSLRQEWMGS